MSPRYVVIVTGSRATDDTHRARVHRDLDTLLDRVTTAGGRLVIRHGACPTGVDEYASEWVRQHQEQGVVEERYPADWNGPCHNTCKPRHRKPGKAGNSYCPQAGPRRNKAMVDDGADEVWAFPLGASPGTYSCVDLARKARLPVRFPPEVLERVS